MEVNYLAAFILIGAIIGSAIIIASIGKGLFKIIKMLWE